MNQPVRILYVDDYPLDRELVRDALEKEHVGFELVEAASRPDFEAALARGGFDLILSDFNILGFEGLQVLETVQATGLNLPVIIVTGTGSEEVAAEAIKRGAADYVLKSPKHIQRLPHTIHAVLEKKRLEDEARQAEAELHESEERYRLLFENSGEAILLTQPDGPISSVNPEACRIFGRSEDEIKKLGRAGIVDANDPRLQAALEERRRTGHFKGELNLVRKDGSTFPAEVSSTIFKDSRGNERTSMIIRDVTERKQVEEKIRTLNAELEQRVEERTRELREAQEQLVLQAKLAVLGRLAGGVGHELRNPLSVILNAIYYLKLVQPDATEKIRQYHGMIEQEAHTAEKIISDLLDFAHVRIPDREPVSVDKLVRQTLEHSTIPPSVKVTLKLPAGLPMAFADPRQMEQVLGNLVVNACQAMASQGSATSVGEGGRLTISASRQKEMVAIAVKDTGVGIPPENMKKLFEPLFTTKINGIGLGLAVSKKLAEANGGRIEVQSEPGNGSKFTLVLPVHEGEQ